MISQFSADGRETRYDPRQMTRWEDRDTDSLECWHGPLERWEGTVCFAREHGAIFLDRNEASITAHFREECRALRNTLSKMARGARQLADIAEGGE